MLLLLLLRDGRACPALRCTAGLLEVLMTGGIPPDVSQACSAEDVYRRLYTRVLLQNEKYYSRCGSWIVQSFGMWLAGCLGAE